MSRRRTQNESASLRAGGVQDAQPSGSSTFLSGARNVVISDGEFNNVQGTHTNLVINLNQSPPTQGPFRNRITSNDPSVSSHRNTPNPVREARPRVPESENFASNQLPEVQQSNIIYQRHLELKGHGFPLWIPPPNQNLPIQYRRTGVCIGDVGIITPNGGFSYLFNICLPHDDPVNRRLPENFSPISEATDIDKFPVFDDDSHLASASIVKALPDSPSSGVQFESSASEGAILTMPLGATSERLGNFASFRRYAASNMIDWYKFVNGVLGREAKNGDIRLVVGCVKTSTWGIATFANQSRQSSCRLSFCPLEVPSSDSISSDSSRYVWEYSGTADVRTGPSSGERNGLKQADDPGDVVFENQCLFLCTLNATLPDKTWSEIHRDLDPSNLQLRGDLHPASAKDSVSTRYPINPSSATKNTPSTLSSHKLGKRRSPDLHSELQNDIIAFGDKPAVLDSDPLPTPISHPSGGLNGVLMTMVPAARMVITHDDDWSSVASKYDTFPDPHKLLEHILVSHHICEEDGIIFLDRREASESGISNIQEDLVNSRASSSKITYKTLNMSQTQLPHNIPTVTSSPSVPDNVSKYDSMRSIFVKLLPSSTERSGDWQAIEISDITIKSPTDIASITLSIDSLTRHTIFDSAEDKSKEVTLILAPATPILGQLFVSVKQEGLFQRSKDITIRKHDLLYKARSVNTDANEREYRRMTVDGIEIVARFIHQRSKDKKARKDRPLFTKPPRGELNKTASRAKAHDVKTRPKLYREDSVTWGLGN